MLDQGQRSLKTVVAIVPAAGLSRRFGGPNKLLQPWDGGSVVGSVVQTLVETGLPVIVVTGRDANLVSEAAGPSRSVFNPKFEDGLGTSIAAGVAASEPCQGFLIALGDMPGLRAEVVRMLLEAFQLAPPGSLLSPVYSEEPERPGHPVLFDSTYRADLEALSGDEGARAVLQSNRHRLQLVPVGGALGDIDTKGDL